MDDAFALTAMFDLLDAVGRGVESKGLEGAAMLPPPTGISSKLDAVD